VTLLPRRAPSQVKARFEAQTSYRLCFLRIETLDGALTKAGERPPYVLVGHSSGGMIVRLYATRFPERVKGIVLVDSSHEDQLKRFGDPPLPRPGPGVVLNVPEVVDIVAMSDALNARKWRADIPLLVLTRGSAREARSSTPPDAASLARYEIWLDLQRDLASRSSRSEHIIAKQSGHLINIDEPQFIVDGVRRIVSGR
jgi:pimeloyl-ACP methyl ester carboxylesterase